MKLQRILLIAAMAIFQLNISSAQNEGFILSTKNFQPYFPTYIGNGHFSLSSTRLGTEAAESYMIKVYDHGKDDIPRIAQLPAWNKINFFNGKNWLNSSSEDTTQFENYIQKLDMYNGTIETSYIWNVENRKTKINVFSFVSRSDKNLAVIKFELTTDFTDTVVLSFSLKQREEPKRLALAKLKKIEPNPPGAWPKEWYPGFIRVIESNAEKNSFGGDLTIYSKCEGRNTFVAESSEIMLDDKISNPKITVIKDKVSASIKVKFNAEKNKTYTFYKIISIVSGSSDKSYLVRKAKEISRKAVNTGFERLLFNHKREWNRLWQTDIIVDGDLSFQKIIRSMIFYLLCSVDKNTNFSIPPMGLSTAGYYGHIFWDADTYMFPPLLFMHPGIAKSMVMFRSCALQSAKENAAINKYKGAMYPWESDELGKETTPFFAYQNALGENHIVGDVALAQWQYFLAMRDTNWLRQFGSEVIFETANFWVSRVKYNKEKDRYEIGNVVSVSEGLVDVSNETYTNSIAKINLELAIKASKVLGTKVNPEWEKISKKMFIPYNEKEEYHPTYGNVPAGEGATELWSSVTNLLAYPLQMDMSDNVKRNDLLHAVESLKKNGAGANMGVNFLPIIAAELKLDSLFNFTIEKTLKGYLRPPFNVLAETHSNNSINFITGAGAFLQQVIFGYTGLRLTDEGFVQKYKPMLPKNISKLTLKNFTVDNKKVTFVIEENKLTKIPVN
ncbi:hypothetical protein ABRY23_09435 [Melioribacteraceae bacterium 4301-Me]|uniref:hypothetical protein n=1 Tax=Pyranulibacter aquaticus TaxID=3163344 RepID=UPI00359922DD